jgi:solute carrier family 32 (vesicular inhibitory amino acid transporter)
MATVGAASPDPPNGSPPAPLPGLEQPLLHAHHGTLQPRKETAAGDHEAQLTLEAYGATFVRTCFNGLNGLSGE